LWICNKAALETFPVVLPTDLHDGLLISSLALCLHTVLMRQSFLSPVFICRRSTLVESRLGSNGYHFGHLPSVGPQDMRHVHIADLDTAKPQPTSAQSNYSDHGTILQNHTDSPGTRLEATALGLETTNSRTSSSMR